MKSIFKSVIPEMPDMGDMGEITEIVYRCEKGEKVFTFEEWLEWHNNNYQKKDSVYVKLPNSNELL